MVHANHLLKPEDKNIQNYNFVYFYRCESLLSQRRGRTQTKKIQTYRVNLYIFIGVEVCCRNVGEEHRLKPPGKRVLKGISAPNRQQSEGEGGNYRIQSFLVSSIHYILTGRSN
jgi:hypothetical protein